MISQIQFVHFWHFVYISKYSITVTAYLLFLVLFPSLICSLLLELLHLLSFLDAGINTGINIDNARKNTVIVVLNQNNRLKCLSKLFFIKMEKLIPTFPGSHRNIVYCHAGVPDGLIRAYNLASLRLHRFRQQIYIWPGLECLDA